jgi:hypothetical protein
MSIVVAICGILLLIEGGATVVKASTAMHQISGVVSLAGGVTAIGLAAVIWQLSAIRRHLAKATDPEVSLDDFSSRAREPQIR